MNRLQTLLKTAATSHGMLHNLNVSYVRTYIKQTSTESLIHDLERIDDIDLLRTLQEVGVPARIQEVFYAKIAEV